VEAEAGGRRKGHFVEAVDVDAVGLNTSPGGCLPEGWDASKTAAVPVGEDQCFFAEVGGSAGLGCMGLHEPAALHRSADVAVAAGGEERLVVWDSMQEGRAAREEDRTVAVLASRFV
jgi:hypothetical protein